MHDCFGLRPSLTNPRLSELCVISMEADIASGIAMYILRLFTGEAPFYSEPLSVDLEKNVLLLGHAGYHDVINSDEKFPVKVIPDIEYKNFDPFTGAGIFFKFKPGPVTVVNCVYNGQKLQLTTFEGESLPGAPMLEGISHFLCKSDIPLKRFYEEVF